MSVKLTNFSVAGGETMYRVKRPLKIFGVEYKPLDYIPKEVMDKIYKSDKAGEVFRDWLSKDYLVMDDSASGEIPEITENDLT